MPLSDAQIENCNTYVRSMVNKKYPHLAKEDKEDLAQDAILKFINVYRDRYIDEGCKPQSLAARVLDNLYIDRFTKEQRKNIHHISLDDAAVNVERLNVDDFYDIPEETLNDILVNIRWGGFPVSPFHPTGKVYFYGNGKYRCAYTSKYFNVRTSTIFAKNKLGWDKWVIAMKEFIKGNTNSADVARKMGVTQKTAWNCIYKLKLATKDKDVKGISLVRMFEICFDYKVYDDVDILVPPVPQEEKPPRKHQEKIEVKPTSQTVEQKPTMSDKLDTDKVKQLIRFCIDNDLPLPIEYVENYNKNHKL